MDHETARVLKLAEQLFEAIREYEEDTDVQFARFDQIGVIGIGVLEDEEGNELELAFTSWESKARHVKLGMLHMAIEDL